jgi:RNA polymerase sigma-70 factor, ECF subfamily
MDDDAEGEPSLAELRAGDHAAFDRLYARYAARVTGYLVRLTGSRAAAEDLTQETFLASYNGRALYQGRGRPLAWLMGIASRRGRDWLRRPHPATAELHEDLPAYGSTPEEKAVARVALEGALCRLEPPFREALLLVASQGFTYQEAAEAMGEPVGTVKWRVHRATRRLREFLAEGGEGEVKGDVRNEGARDDT